MSASVSTLSKAKQSRAQSLFSLTKLGIRSNTLYH